MNLATTPDRDVVRTRGGREARRGEGEGSRLWLDRGDIRFRDVAPGVVRLSVTIRNTGDRASEAASVAVEAALLGAFVPWSPLGVLSVPSIVPGGEAEVSLDAARPAARSLGPPDRVTPRRLLTALGAGDEGRGPLPDVAPATRFGRQMLRMIAAMAGATRPGADVALAGLPVDLFDAIGSPNPHWAGNFNVFVHERPVERHLAQAVRIYPGRANYGLFMVGSRPDAYRIDLSGSGARWDTVVLAPHADRPLALAVREGRRVDDRGWFESGHGSVLVLAMRPPAGCTGGEVNVHVERRSTGECAIVEFSLDPDAAGAGCYVV
jgi:hypothetical protein